MGVATVITSGKGGVGKSTVAVGLGCALAARGRRVLLIDCDAGLRSLDRMTGIEEKVKFDISDVVYGRCAPVQAIYPSVQEENLFLLPGAAQPENMVRPGVMLRLVPLLKRYYDHVLLDSPAGVGSGFRAASCAADRAIVVCSSDPVCIRGTRRMPSLLERLNVTDVRLVINRFNKDFFRETGAYVDLDGVIDGSGIQLFGLVPEDFSLASSFLRGKRAEERTPGMMAISRVAGRLDGETIPLPM